jgi:hypothetical protein
MVDGRRVTVEHARRADGTAFVGRGVPAQMEAATAQAVGGTVRRPDPAAAAGTRRGGTAMGRATPMAVAPARARRPACRPGALRRGANWRREKQRTERARTAATIGLRRRIARGPKRLRSHGLEHLIAFGAMR